MTLINYSAIGVVYNSFIRVRFGDGLIQAVR